jgi:hypothetical protein
MYWPKFKQTLFPGQQADEEVLIVLREHWLVFFLRLLTWFMFAAFLMLGDWAISHYLPVLTTAPYIAYVNLIKSVYLMFLVLGLLIVFVMYYLNIQIITNKRIVDITQISLLHHTVSELHLSRIEDVTAEVSGIFGTFLDYGCVYIQTAGETERFTFHKIPNPQRIEKMILDLYEQLPDNEKTKDK